MPPPKTGRGIKLMFGIGPAKGDKGSIGRAVPEAEDSPDEDSDADLMAPDEDSDADLMAMEDLLQAIKDDDAAAMLAAFRRAGMLSGGSEE